MTLPSVLSLHHYFEHSVRRCGQATALAGPDSNFTYAQVDEWANRWARRLRDRGVQRGDRVALMLPRCAELYVAKLAILKAGACYVPIDPSAPRERKDFILQDCQARHIIDWGEVSEGVSPSENIDWGEVSEGVSPSENPEGSPHDLAYILYTSGTTGRPKGCLIEHAQVIQLVRAEQELYQIRPDDRIFQFASITFDASVEEIWMAFAHGATLVWGPQSVVRSGLDFAQHLREQRITVLSCVPTFLAMVEDDIPELRILILGGEACNPQLVERWWRPGRTLWNTYGPTETTVIATAAQLQPGQPVTIGRPISGYQVELLDEQLERVGPGQVGEICIGGSGVARGYLNRPELTAEKFISWEGQRLYRSSDLGRWNEQGQLEYLGRNDNQVKIRGYRVELSEIESVMLESPGVQAAAVTVTPDGQRLAAYYVASRDQPPDLEALEELLKTHLPSYMLPAFLDPLEALPQTLAGKVDRRALPPPRQAFPRRRQQALSGPRNPDESLVYETFCQVLAIDQLSIHDDFFLDLGGHSLLAAQTVSQLRQHSGFQNLSVGTLYQQPTVAQIATHRVLGQAHSEPDLPPRVSALRHFLCGLGQALGLIPLSGVYAWQWLGAYLTYGYLVVTDEWSIAHALVGAILVNILTTPTILALTIGAKWLLLGRLRPGKYPLWGWFYWRFWFVRALLRASPVQYLSGTPWLNWYYRCMGARIGRGVYLGSHGLTTFDLLEVADGCSVGADTTLDGSSVDGPWLRLGTIRLGPHCWVGNRCSLGLNTCLEEGSGLDDLSMLPDGSVVPGGQLWRGSPARAAGELARVEDPLPCWGPLVAFGQLGGIAAFPLMVLTAVFPGLMLITHLGHQDEGYRFLMVAPLVGMTFVFCLCSEIWLLKWALLGRLGPGRRPLNSLFFLRVWLFEKIMELSLEVVGTLYTTLYISPWLRSLGGRLGARCEVSTIRFIQPDLVEAEAECFFADDVSVGAARVRGGWIRHQVTHFGRRTFLGNGAVIPAGTRMGSQVLVGCVSLPPPVVQDGTSWFGSPPQALAARQKPQEQRERLTYQPPTSKIVQRLLWELVRIVLPSTLFVILAALIIDVTDILQDHIGHGEWLMVLPFLYMTAGLLAIACTVALKWLLVGRYRSAEKPLWSSFIWKTELVTGLYENFAVMFFLDLLRGTVFLPWVLRAFGMKVGARCYIDSTWFTEFDLIELGQEVVLNEQANLQTHLFQDRVMSTGPLQVGDGCVIGSMSTVLYHTQMGPHCRLGDLSLIMKGESLPAHGHWHGSPAVPAS